MSSVLTAASSFYQQVLRSASPKRTTVLVVIVLGLLATMAWTQVKEKEQNLIQRNIRLLNLWSNDISKKIESYETVLQTTLRGTIAHLSDNEVHAKNTMGPEGDRTRWLRNKSETEELTTQPPDFSVECLGEIAEVRNDTSVKEIKSDLIRDFKRLCEAEGLEAVSVRQVENHGGGSDLKVLRRQSPPRIQLIYKDSHIKLDSLGEKDSQSETPLTKNKHPLALEAAGTINLQNFLDRLWRHQIYDEILLFEKKKPKEKESQSLIYHSGANGMTWRNFQELKEYRVSETLGGTLFSSKEQTTSENSSSLQDKHFKISIPGQTFQVFTQPILFPSNEKQQWILVGLVQQEKFVNDSLAISSTLLLGMMFLLLGLVLAVPLFHLKTMGPKDPLRSVHILGLMLSALLGAGLVTFLILDISIYLQGKSDLEDRMTEAAQSIKNEMLRETKSVLSTLKAFDSSIYLQRDCATILNTTSPDNPSDTCFSSNEEVPVRQRSVLLEERIAEASVSDSDRIGELSKPYADFLYAFWMDHDGSLRINWARDKFQQNPVHGMTQNFLLHEREYVRSVIDSSNRLWQFPNEPSLSPFFLQPIISWTTGLNTVVASMKSRLEDPKGKNWVAAIEFKFKSLMDHIVLPPGIGFAVIDNADKQVLFHSEEWRNLREPFLVETDHNAMLLDLLSAKTAGHAEGSYWGKPHRFFLLPLDPIPWSLVIFRDMEMLRSVNLVGLLIAGFLYSLWAFSIYIALLIFLHWQKRHRRAPWLWPDKNKHITFSILCVANVALFIVLMVIIILLWDSPLWQVTVAWIIPFVWVVYSVSSCLKQKCQSSLENNNRTSPAAMLFSRWSYPQSYSLMLTSFLLILGVAPAFACFSAVFNQEIKLFTQYQLLQLVQTFQDSPKDKPFLQHLKDSCLLISETNNTFADDGFPRGIYPELYSKIRQGCNSVSKNEWQKKLNESRDRTIFQKAFALASQPFSPLIKHASLLGFIADTWPANAETERNLWESDGRQITLQYLLTEHNNEEKLRILSFSTDLPFIAWFAKENFPTFEKILALRKTPLEQYLSYGLIAGTFLVIFYFYLYSIPKFIANRVLFLSYTPPTGLPMSTLFSNENKSMKDNRVVIGFPGQGKTNRAKESNLLSFDLKTVSPQDCYFSIKDMLKTNKDKRSIHLILDHFDHQWKDPQQNMEKLRLLERLYQEHWDVDGATRNHQA